MLTSTVATLHDNSTHGEDNYLVRDLGDHDSLDAVMDGVTGRRGGQASQAVVEALAAASLRSPDDVVAVLEDVNRRLYQVGWGRFLLTTVSAVLFQRDRLHVVGAGDSSVLLIRPDSVQQLSSGVRGYWIGVGRALAHLYRAEVPIAPGDRVVLATDGVTDNLSRGELVAIVQSAISPEDAVTQINTILAGRHQGGLRRGASAGGLRRDDWTAIVRFFSPTAAPAVSSRSSQPP